MTADIDPLEGKYYGTGITISDEYGKCSIRVWRVGDGTPSKRQLSEWGLTSEQWEQNAEVDNGWGGMSGCRELYVCDSHYETHASYETATRIVSALMIRNTVLTTASVADAPVSAVDHATLLFAVGSVAWVVCRK